MREAHDTKLDRLCGRYFSSSPRTTRRTKRNKIRFEQERERERNGKRRWRDGAATKPLAREDGGRDAKSLLDIRATLKNYPEISGDEKGREGKPREEESIKVRLDLLVFAAAPLALPSHCHAAGT